MICKRGRVRRQKTGRGDEMRASDPTVNMKVKSRNTKHPCPSVQKTDLASSRQAGRWDQSLSIYSSRLLFSCQALLLHPGYKENPNYPTIPAGGRWTSTWPSAELLIVDSFLSTTQSVTSQGAHQLELCILQ